MVSSIKKSNLPSCQSWIEQFNPEDRTDARDLIDELIYIETSSVIDDLTSEIKKIIKDEEKVSIIPVREVSKDEVSYFDLIDKSKNPVFNMPNEPLGSEAITSNLVTRLRRGYGKSVVLEHNQKTKTYNTPSLSCMRAEKVKAIILVDDVIGSGKRTLEFFNFVYKHKTIKSWVSSGVIKIYILSYMATNKGITFLSENINKNLVKIIKINKCPTFYDSLNSSKFIQLCKRYANKNELYPLGFKDSFVKVFFEHSAPNNMPSILHKNIKIYKGKDENLLMLPNQWKALFPSRGIPRSLIVELSSSKNTKNMKQALRSLLKIMISLEITTLANLIKLTKIEKVHLKQYIKICVGLDILKVQGNNVSITNRTKNEYSALCISNKGIDINESFYYPNR
ncbi:hypothetical protein I6E72_15185 [Pseudoalteromonas sp. NSLLW24]|uniref:phosphoribosyltransferase-like protein n=1 Tax=Pseudoalteromonas sp. NSLLW24 TaxID=2792050 RepID=UPI0018CD77B1|nr:hypothetical protein [Pseudoalteromonas sp. NSLLW24]MBH0000299.1 hypothetical protein [Pseudoalteromonas sp. NSLLW24]